MGKTKSKEQIYNEIIEEMPDDLNEIETSAFIMYKIAKERSFSSRYYWADKETRDNIYQSCVNKVTKKRENKRQLICVTATKMYKEIAQRLGLDVYIIGDIKLTKNDYSVFKPGEHISPVIRTKNGEYIKADIEWDLENIQTGRRWIKFGTVDENQDILKTLSQEELDNVMKKIGYINSKEDYLENAFEKLNLDSPMLSLEEKLNKLFSDKEITEHVLKLKSGIDIFRFYRRAIKEYIPDSDSIALYGGYSQKNIKKGKKYTILVDLEENNKDKFWIWSNRKHQMQRISNEFVTSFIDSSLVKIVPGKKYIERCKNMLNRIHSINRAVFANESLDEFLCR